ncbi:hypothetical protein [Sorangium sp. So ce1097]|uniref:hypothetical protein n=1 Tax=Sorangium sp. So ce1097 TaxID=3133330 RepID=UPI003F62C674
MGLGSMMLLSCLSAQIAEYNAKSIAAVRKRASFDLSCAPEKLNIIELGRDNDDLLTTLGVVGCEKKATYVNLGNRSGWALDVGERKADAPAPQ